MSTVKIEIMNENTQAKGAEVFYIKEMFLGQSGILIKDSRLLVF